MKTNLKSKSQTIILKVFSEEEDKKNKWYLRKNPCFDSLISIYNYYSTLDDKLFQDAVVPYITSLYQNFDNMIEYYSGESMADIYLFPLEQLSLCLFSKIFIGNFYNEYAMESGESYVRFFVEDGYIKALWFMGLDYSTLEFLGLFPNLKELEKCAFTRESYKGLEKVKNLEVLVIEETELTDINEINELGSLKCLKKLEITENNLKEITGLEKMDNLIELNLEDNNTETIEKLDSLKKLITLNLNSNDINLIKNLSSLINLQRLNLSNNRIRDIKGLEKLKNLKILFLNGNKINNINGLETLVNLEVLYLSGNNISNINGIEKLQNLETLAIRNNKISSIKELESLNKLKHLEIKGNNIPSEEINLLQNKFSNSIKIR